MEQTISELLARYEAGSMTRPQVIAELALLVSADTEVAIAPLSGGTLDHLGLQVMDLARSVTFYRDVLGCTVPPGARPDTSVRLDLPKGGFLTLREANPGGNVDHFCVRLATFNKEAVVQELKAQGITAIDEPLYGGTGAGFHIVDPDGLRVQLL